MAGHRTAAGGAVLAFLAAMIAVASPAAADHGPDAATVVVQATAFQPYKVQVAPGGTVTWDVREGGHTIVANDGRFNFGGATGQPIPAGETRSHTVGEEAEFIAYHCSIHGSSMAGVLVVGHPSPAVADPTVIAVPGNDPANPMTIEGAVAAARPGTRIEIAPGHHLLSDRVEVDLRDEDHLPQGLTIVGMGDEPSDVTLEVALIGAQGAVPSVLHVTGSFVSLRNLTVLGGAVRSDGAVIHLDGANQAALWDVVVDGQSLAGDGVRITDASGAGLHGVAVDDVRGAGIRVETCAACGVLIEDAVLRGGLVGLLASGAHGVILRGSDILANTVGVVARRADSRLASIRVHGNHITGNVERTLVPAYTNPDRRLATGAGVWLDGAVDSHVTGNRITDNTFGVAVSGGAREVTVRANTLGGNGTDLAWDGLGANTCFEDLGPAATTSPPWLADMHPCGPPTVGLPYPPVIAALLVAAYT